MKKFNKLAITSLVSILIASSAYSYVVPKSNLITLGTITTQNTVLEDEGSTIALTGLNVRDEPNIKCKVIGTIPYNSKVELVEKSGDFYKIKYNSSFGYIHSKYVKVVEVVSKNEESVKASATATTSVSNKDGVVSSVFGLNVRSEANIKGKKLGMLSNKSKIEIVEKVGEWYKIKYNKELGYVNSKYIKLDGNISLEPTATSEKKK